MRAIALMAILVATPLAAQDKTDLDRPALGLRYVAISDTQELLKKLKLDLPTKIGILISRADAYGPIDRAGLKALDVIVKVGRNLVRTSDDFKKEIDAMVPGREYRLTGYRSLKPGGIGPWKKGVIKVTPVARKDLYLNALRKEKDTIQNVTFFTHRDSAKTVSSQIDFFCYIVQNSSGDASLRLKIQYVAKDWLFIRQFTIKADDQTFILRPANTGVIERDNAGGKIWEWYDQPVRDPEMTMLTAVANAKNVVVRFEGTQYQKDLKFVDAVTHRIHTFAYGT